MFCTLSYNIQMYMLWYGSLVQYNNSLALPVLTSQPDKSGADTQLGNPPRGRPHGALVLFFNYLCPEFFFFQFKNIQNENRPLDPRLLLPGCSHCLWLRWQTSRRSFCFWSVDQRSTNMCCCQGSSRSYDSCKYLQVAPIEIVVNLELAYSKNLEPR